MSTQEHNAVDLHTELQEQPLSREDKLSIGALVLDMLEDEFQEMRDVADWRRGTGAEGWCCEHHRLNDMRDDAKSLRERTEALLQEVQGLGRPAPEKGEDS